MTGIEQPFLDTDMDTIKTMFDTNVFGPMEMVGQFLPLLLSAKGIVVNVGSEFFSPALETLSRSKILQSVG